MTKRAGILFLNFFLIILAYYQVKSASRSIIIEYGGADLLPRVWIISAVVLASLIGPYHRLVERHSRLHVVLGSCLLFIVLLIMFRLRLVTESTAVAVAFYVFVDILSVVLVEQFWSLANTVNDTDEGKRTYWLVGTGGVLGGGVGGWVAARLVEHTAMTTPDLLLACAALLALVLIVNLMMARAGLYTEVADNPARSLERGSWRAVFMDRYLLLIAVVLLCAQLAEPIVEYQWAKAIEKAYTDLDERTTFYGDFFLVLSLVSVGVNLTLTPLVHRHLGVIAGLLVQPLTVSLTSLGFVAHPTLWVASAMKIGDRGLSYSINRASKEVLYIPVDPVRTYQAKAWIDMLGYRLFKVLGSSLILIASAQSLPWAISAPQLGWVTLGVCATWIALVFMLAREFNAYALEPTPA